MAEVGADRKCGPRLHVCPGNRFDVEPFVQGGLGVYFLDSQHFGAQSVGSGFQAGGGVDFRLSPHVDLGLRGLYRGLAMGPANAGFDDTFVSAMTAEANLTIRF